MTDWLKEHKVYLLAAALLAAVLLYPNLFNSEEEEVRDLPEEWSVETKDEGKAQAKEKPEQENEVSVPMMADIKGAVKKPGVYDVHQGERVIDLIEKAGGLTNKADTASINFAMKIGDEMAIYIPEKGGQGPLAGQIPVSGGGESTGNSQKVNLNSASASELETLPGIGPSKSAAIIEFRETSGAFKTVDDLKLISGIGDKTFEKLRELITVK
ncbi:helix-hairpin-helix domain-containing protein [Mesobacillus foraminis]|uniref:helix-hairpin-helix domain-containing protein n=1 Tax=Mesobacillus foraminis TaxID=279826 RepID=UPI001BEA62A8|nr:helix-hairpin-helix domain-containing protein [Mesobacillus foraminis]MBT2754658.1 helix-hairpin-helix domain-containing protein [Mesobacillus foraminis]